MDNEVSRQLHHLVAVGLDGYLLLDVFGDGEEVELITELCGLTELDGPAEGY